MRWLGTALNAVVFDELPFAVDGVNVYPMRPAIANRHPVVDSVVAVEQPKCTAVLDEDYRVARTMLVPPVMCSGHARKLFERPFFDAGRDLFFANIEMQVLAATRPDALREEPVEDIECVAVSPLRVPVRPEAAKSFTQD